MGSFGISEGNITGREKKKKKTHNMYLSATPNGEVAKMLAYHQQAGLNWEARAALLKVRAGPECPKDNLRDLM